MRTHLCFTYDQHSWGTYHHQFQVHLYKLQRGIPYQMSYLQQGLHRRDRKTPGGRSREHLRSTRQSNTDLPVCRHFASPGHTCTDMPLLIIHSDFRDTQNRRLFEAGMIFKHKTLHPGGLNTDFVFRTDVRALADASSCKPANKSTIWLKLQPRARLFKGWITLSTG